MVTDNQAQTVPPPNLTGDFAAWTETQAKALDRKVDLASARAAALRGELSRDAWKNWEEIRAAVDYQRRELAKHMARQRSASRAEWKDIQAATLRSLDHLSARVDDLVSRVAMN